MLDIDSSCRSHGLSPRTKLLYAGQAYIYVDLYASWAYTSQEIRRPSCRKPDA